VYSCILYFYRDTITRELNPQIWRLKNFIESFGDSERHVSQLPIVFKETEKHVEVIRSMIRDIEMMSEDLKTKLQIKAINASLTLVLYKTHENLTWNNLDYGHWLETIEFDALDNILHFTDFSPFKTIAGLISKIFSVVSEERMIKQQLSAKITEMSFIKQKLEEAKADLVQFKIYYHSHIIRSLKRFIKYVKSDFPRFWKLLRAFTFQKINMRSLSLVNNYLQKVSDTIQEKKISTQNVLLNVNKHETIVSSLTSIVENGISFDKIYKLSNQIREKQGFSPFRTKFDLLRFIADFITNKSCYWGIDLGRVRRGELHQSDWLKVPVCLSSEMQESLIVVKTGVAENLAPCRLLRQLGNHKFDNIFKLLRFLADNVIPNVSCYWGYNIESIRKMNTVFEFESKFPIIDSKIINFLHVALKILPTKKVVFNKLCELKNVCIKSEEFRNNLIKFASTGQCGHYVNGYNPSSRNTTLKFDDNYC